MVTDTLCSSSLCVLCVCVMHSSVILARKMVGIYSTFVCQKNKSVLDSENFVEHSAYGILYYFD